MVKPGDIVRVKVMDVDIPRKRISLTLRLEDEAGADRSAGAPREREERRGGARPPQQRGAAPQGGQSGQSRRGQGGGQAAQGGQGGQRQGGGQGQGQGGQGAGVRAAGRDPERRRPPTARWQTPCAGPASPARRTVAAADGGSA